jgi:hypothetical protein
VLSSSETLINTKAKEYLNITIWQKLDLLDNAMSDPYIEVCPRSHIGCTQRAVLKNEDNFALLKRASF